MSPPSPRCVPATRVGTPSRASRVVDSMRVTHSRAQIRPRQLNFHSQSSHARARRSSTRFTRSSGERVDANVLNASAKFAYAWVTLGYVAPSALASGRLGETSDAEHLAIVALTCETIKAYATYRVVNDSNDDVLRDAVEGWASGRAVLDGVAFGAVACVCARVVDGASAMLFGASDGIDKIDASTLATSADGGALATLAAAIAACVVAPALEEFFFRGFLYDDLITRSGSNALAVTISSMVFAVAHFSPRDVPSLATCGVVFAFAKSTPSGLPAAVVAHAVFNASVLVERALAS